MVIRFVTCVSVMCNLLSFLLFGEGIAYFPYVLVTSLHDHGRL